MTNDVEPLFLFALLNCNLYIFFHEVFVQGFFLFFVGLFVFLSLCFKSFCGFNNFFDFPIGIYNLVKFLKYIYVF